MLTGAAGSANPDGPTGPAGSAGSHGSNRTPGPFFRYDLRTTDVGGAAEFYRAVAGLEIAERNGSTLLMAGGDGVGVLGRVVPIPERARAAGAPAHWLGHVSVSDLAGSLERLESMGGERLGSLMEDGEGRPFATVRDPQGAGFAVGSSGSTQERPAGPGRESSDDDLAEEDLPDVPPRPGGSPPAVAWHQLHTTDLGAAWTFYSELFGWRKTHTLELGEGIGTYQLFTWDGIEGSVGAMAETARQPHVHLHWAFYLGVDDIDDAVEAVRRLGGWVVDGPRAVPGGSRMAYCEDPQRGAFGLREP